MHKKSETADKEMKEVHTFSFLKCEKLYHICSIVNNIMQLQWNGFFTSFHCLHYILCLSFPFLSLLAIQSNWDPQKSSTEGSVLEGQIIKAFVDKNTESINISRAFLPLPNSSPWCYWDNYVILAINSCSLLLLDTEYSVTFLGFR